MEPPRKHLHENGVTKPQQQKNVIEHKSAPSISASRIHKPLQSPTPVSLFAISATIAGWRPFGRFGPLPRDYYTWNPRGFGFVQYVDPDDAANATYHMDGQVLLGRELTVVFAEENRKKPSVMRSRDRGRSYDSRRSGYSRSPRYSRAYSRSPDYYSPPRRRGYSRSISPRVRRYRELSYSRSPYGSRSCSRSRSYSRSRSQSLDYSR